MLKVILTVGIIASGKSTWAKDEVQKNPTKVVRVNRDDLRVMMSNYVYSEENEKLVVATRNHIIVSALKRGKDVIIDDTNLNRRNFDDICKLVREASVECMVMEKPFYIDLDEAIERNAKRTGHACIPEDVIRQMWKKSGGTQHKFYKGRVEIIGTIGSVVDKATEPLIQDSTLPKVAIFDNDGTISLVHSGRNPYDARTCDQDLPHLHVIEALRLYFNAGYKIIFVSGREEKDREPTERFYKMYFPEVKYELYMRATGDKRKDVIIKEEIYNDYIKNKYNVIAWFDDRLQVCQWIYQKGLPLFRVNNPEATF